MPATPKSKGGKEPSRNAFLTATSICVTALITYTSFIVWSYLDKQANPAVVTSFQQRAG